MITMVVFDMAGTTVDENNVVYKTVREAINEEGFDFSLEQVLEVGAGKEKLQAIKSVLALVGKQDDNLANKIFENFRQKLENAYRTQDIFEQSNATRLFHTLKQQGIKVVLNTGYNRETAETLVEKIGWKIGDDIDALVTASDVGENRPKPDMILYAMKQLGVSDAKEVIKVGDSSIDVEEGKNAGCSINIGITTGAHTYEQLKAADPEYIINDLLELLPIVKTANESARSEKAGA
ncbi:phosphonatase-like hydrolase [Danxiaibacter flavus]|uniref:Phosphonatase-like hydrolase n=1 Tax=Danxiaibacter flavus TaxID=3049108 RepID=A0ABV3ZPP1_9BACT|nr:phosphonatase-like hydrolase [Chitinophagaceae bacterium DXS]